MGIETADAEAFIIRVGVDSSINLQTVCNTRHENSSSDGGKTFSCFGGLLGRYVSIQNMPRGNASDLLVLCEIEVQGYRFIPSKFFVYQQ